MFRFCWVRKKLRKGTAMGQKPVPPVNIPIASKIYSKTCGAPKPPKWDQFHNGFDNHGHMALSPTQHKNSWLEVLGGDLSSGAGPCGGSGDARGAHAQAAGREGPDRFLGTDDQEDVVLFPMLVGLKGNRSLYWKSFFLSLSVLRGG